MADAYLYYGALVLHGSLLVSIAGCTYIGGQGGLHQPGD